MTQQPEKISNMERMHQQWEERKQHAGQIRLPHQYRNGPNPEAEAEGKRREKAKAIPDSQFDDDAEVQHLRTTSEARALAADNHYSIRKWLEAEREHLMETIRAAEEGLLWATLDDAAHQEADFPRTSKALADVQRAQELVKAIDRAHDLVASSDPNQLRRLYGAATQAEDALKARLWELKLATVGAEGA